MCSAIETRRAVLRFQSAVHSAVPHDCQTPPSWPRNSSKREVQVVDENGAPAGEKLFVFYNPPMVNRNLGIRRSYINESTRVAKELLHASCRRLSSPTADCTPRYCSPILQQANPPKPAIRTSPRLPWWVSAGGTAGNRARITRGADPGTRHDQCSRTRNRYRLTRRLRDGGLRGLDCFDLQAPERAGRRSGSSCAVFVASSAPLDQFIVQHPDYFLGVRPSTHTSSPTIFEILVNHLKCAAFELLCLPMNGSVTSTCRSFASGWPKPVSSIVVVGLALGPGSDPADTISLRSVTSEQFVINRHHREGNGEPEVLGEVDFSSALTTVHPKRSTSIRGRVPRQAGWILTSAKRT